MKELIERLEKATGPDRELDAEIAVATFLTVATDDDLIYARLRDPGHDATHPGHYFVKSRSGAQAASAPNYTSSIDALRSQFPYLCVFASDIGADGLPMVKLVVDTSASPIIEYTGIAATLELAWCIAALKARSLQESTS